MFENEELIKFYTDIQEEIKFSLLTEEEGPDGPLCFFGFNSGNARAMIRGLHF